jgi:predicted O-methyltransferase YrrM
MGPGSGTGQVSRTESTIGNRDWMEIAHQAVQDHRAIQHSAELSVLLTAADHAQVKTVLEIGCFAGGTAWAFAQLPSVQRIITVDHDPQAEAYPVIAALAGKATLIKGESSDHTVRDRVRHYLDGNLPDLLFIDGAHDLTSVTDDWQIYGPMTGPGSMVAFHNVEPHQGRPDVEVHLLWSAVRSAYPSVKITAAPGEWAGLGIIWR